MNKVYDLKNIIQSVTTGGLVPTGTISYVGIKDSNNIIHCDAEQLTKSIAIFFGILNDYPNLQSIEIDEKVYNFLLKDFEEYKINNLVNKKLDNALKQKLNALDKKELYLEYNKYFQNLLTNKEVLRYIKEMIDKKDYYSYEKYDNYTKEQCKDEIKTLNKIFDILKNVEYRENSLGIKEKYISFEPGSYEYENISPFISFDVYDINHYKRVLELLKEKLSKL